MVYWLLQVMGVWQSPNTCSTTSHKRPTLSVPKSLRCLLRMQRAQWARRNLQQPASRRVCENVDALAERARQSPAATRSRNTSSSPCAPARARSRCRALPSSPTTTRRDFQRVDSATPAHSMPWKVHRWAGTSFAPQSSTASPAGSKGPNRTRPDCARSLAASARCLISSARFGVRSCSSSISGGRTDRSRGRGTRCGSPAS